MEVMLIALECIRTKGEITEEPYLCVYVGDDLVQEIGPFEMRRGDTEFRLLVNAGLSSLYASGVMRQAFDATIPGATPGLAIEAMYLLAPTLP